MNALHGNRTLTALDLSGNRLGLDRTAGSMARLLAAQSSDACALRTLVLKDTHLGSNYVCQLAEALASNDTLTELDLSGNSFGDEGAAALARALRRNDALEVLSLRHAGILYGGAESLLYAVTTNDLCRLRLWLYTRLCAALLALGLLGLHARLHSPRRLRRLHAPNVALRRLELDNNRWLRRRSAGIFASDYGKELAAAIAQIRPDVTVSVTGVDDGEHPLQEFAGTLLLAGAAAAACVVQ